MRRRYSHGWGNSLTDGIINIQRWLSEGREMQGAAGKSSQGHAPEEHRSPQGERLPRTEANGKESKEPMTIMATVNHISPGAATRVEVPATPRPPARTPTPPDAPDAPRRAPDTVDLSEQARYLDALRTGADVRTNLVQRVRAAIEAGTYDTSDKLDAAVENLLDDLIP